MSGDMFDRAIDAYYRSCERAGAIPQQPCKYSSYVDGDLIVLVNVRGELARYEIRQRRNGAEFIRRVA